MKETERETAVAGEEPTKYQQGSTHDWPKPYSQTGGRLGGEGRNGAPLPTTKSRSDTITKQKSSSDLTNPANRIKCLKEGGEQEGERGGVAAANGAQDPHGTDAAVTECPPIPPMLKNETFKQNEKKK